ncbi:hypothetical protein CPAV1605_5 [seawater metagenome]|uniref:Uncharacterized protein n=1 Tax=seawater metagenome TaxID=1561972 RepID=A0A5E8CKL4_9ZZZZ
MTAKKTFCNCDCGICNKKFKKWDIVELKNQWGKNDQGIIVDIVDGMVIVSMKAFKGDYSVFPLNSPSDHDVKKIEADDIIKKNIISQFDPWWQENYNLDGIN